LRTALDVLFYSGATRICGSRFRGSGTIFTLHHVRPPDFDPEFSPSRILEVSPEFLELAIQCTSEVGYDFVTLDEARERLLSDARSTPFVCFTLDDGYADNFTDALPIFDRYSVPFTIYVTTGIVDLQVNLWWQHLEDVIRANDTFIWPVDGQRFRLATRTPDEKIRAYEKAYWTIRSLSSDGQEAAVAALTAEYGIDVAASCRATALSWPQLQELVDNRLATIGAHTTSHRALSKLSPEDVAEELSRSREILRQRLGIEVRHVCYPFGDRNSAGRREFDIARGLGFDTATTTRKGVLVPEHRDHLHALPRISLNGDYQEARYVQALLSGLPTALLNRFRKLDVD
jgi:peptidoglycan/xylan/chitin deacetylase (PgdA/CDA1 family)